jgi:hypothetical protein
MQQQSLVSLRLVCDGSRAEAGSSLERNKMENMKLLMKVGMSTGSFIVLVQ